MKYSIYDDVGGLVWPLGLSIFFMVSDHTLVFGMCMGLIFGMIAGMRLHNIIIRSI